MWSALYGRPGTAESADAHMEIGGNHMGLSDTNESIGRDKDHPTIDRLKIFPDAKGEKMWRQEVHKWQSRRLSPDERKHGPRCNAPDGIYIVTVSERTPPEHFEMAHLLNIASHGTRSSQANGFVPTDNYDSAIAVVNGRVAGGVIADVERCMPRTKRLIARGASSASLPVDHPRYGPVVFDLWVHPSHRRRGIGGQLLEAIAAHFGLTVAKVGYRFPIKRNAVRLLRKMGVRTVEGCD